MNSLKEIIVWYTLMGYTVHHEGGFEGFQENKHLRSWYFSARAGDKTVMLNYRKHNGQYELLGNAHVEIQPDLSIPDCEYITCKTITELTKALA